MRALHVLGFVATLVLASQALGQTVRAVPGTAAEITLSFAPVVRQTAPAVVNIYASRVVADRPSPFADDPFFSQFFGTGRGQPRVENSLGSGVILDPQGYVVSNHHVVANASEIRVVLSDRREFAGVVVMDDAEADIAVIRLEGAQDLPALNLGDSDAVEVGDLVLAIGNPFGVGQTVSSGIVSGLARSGANIGSGAGYYIQTDAPINPGNSGGALIDVRGRLIGVNTSILTRSGGSNGIGFAIPANLVRQYLVQARDGKTRFERPWAGVEVQPMDMHLAEAMGAGRPEGVVLSGLHPASPFARAGLRPGDVLLSLDGHPVNAAAELDFRLATRGPGAEAIARFRRGADEAEARIALAVAPDTPPADPRRIAGRTPLEGLTVARANPRLIDEFDLPLDTEGVLIIAIDGYAARLGLRPGDRIVRLNGTPIDTTQRLDRASRTLGRILDMELVRDGRAMRLRLGL